MRVFVDTGAFCALTIPKDHYNSIAKAVYKQIQKDKTLICTSDYVEDIEEHSKDIFRRFDDKKLSYTDCTSFALINQFGIEAVFAFDEHFRYHPYTHSVKFFG